MSRIFWDTNPYIYLLEGAEPFLGPTRALRQRMIARRDELITSTMTLAEIQVGPRRAGNLALAAQLREAVLQTSTIVPFDLKAADLYAQLRENPTIKAPDAIQLSCAASVGVELFITNDVALHRLTIPGIHFITSPAQAPLG
ncbi:MAG: PIN domain-containing protein [Acidobacteriaceae bacterium]